MAEFNQLDLVELSDIAWETVDPADLHEDEERLWVALLPRDWSAVSEPTELPARLAEIVEALTDAADTGRLRLVAAVMTRLASDSGRRSADEALLHEAIVGAFPGHVLPDDVRDALTQRDSVPAGHVRGRAARRPAPHVARHPEPEFDA